MTEEQIHTPPPDIPPAETPPEIRPVSRPATRASVLALIAALLAAALAAVFWFDTRQRLASTQEELAHRLRDISEQASEARTTAGQSRDALSQAQAKISQLEGKLAESQSQQVALEALYQDLSRNRDEWQLAEIEQVLTIASEQLQLAGNVRAALLALQLADSRLAGADRPQFLPIRRALARDIDRLKALPTVDYLGMSARIDTLVAAVDGLPLAFDERTERSAGPKQRADASASGFLARLGAEIWSELKDLVVVRQMKSAEPPLLAPTQAYFLRENLRLRLLNARLSLLVHDEAGYREDLRMAEQWIGRYFDLHAKRTADALAQLKQLSGAQISFDLPTISESLDAVRNYKSRRERKPS